MLSSSIFWIFEVNVSPAFKNKSLLLIHNTKVVLKISSRWVAAIAKTGALPEKNQKKEAEAETKKNNANMPNVFKALSQIAIRNTGFESQICFNPSSLSETSTEIKYSIYTFRPKDSVLKSSRSHMIGTKKTGNNDKMKSSSIHTKYRLPYLEWCLVQWKI